MKEVIKIRFIEFILRFDLNKILIRDISIINLYFTINKSY